MEPLEAFRKYHVSETNKSKAIQRLRELPPSALKIIADSLADEVIKVEGNRNLQHLTLKYFIITQFFEIEKLTIKESKEKAIKLMEGLANGSSTRPDIEPEINEEGEVINNPKPRRGRRNSGTYDFVLDLVRENPEASREEIIEKAVDQLEVAKNTAMVYFYKAKKELKT